MLQQFLSIFFLLKYPKYMYLIERSLSCLLFTIISSIVYLLKAPNTYQDHEISILVRFSSKQVIPSYHKYSHCFRPKTKRAPLCCDNPSAILGSRTLSTCLIFCYIFRNTAADSLMQTFLWFITSACIIFSRFTFSKSLYRIKKA